MGPVAHDAGSDVLWHPVTAVKAFCSPVGLRHYWYSTVAHGMERVQALALGIPARRSCTRDLQFYELRTKEQQKTGCHPVCALPDTIGVAMGAGMEKEALP
jgi:hypothetical protein